MVLSTTILSLFDKNKVSGNQEVKFKISCEFISNKLAILLVNTNTVIFTTQKWIKCQPQTMHK